VSWHVAIPLRIYNLFTFLLLSVGSQLIHVVLHVNVISLFSIVPLVVYVYNISAEAHVLDIRLIM